MSTTSKKLDVSKCRRGTKLIFTHQSGEQEDCELIAKGLVPGCAVVQFFDKGGRPTSMDGLTLPLRQLSEKKS